MVTSYYPLLVYSRSNACSRWVGNGNLKWRTFFILSPSPRVVRHTRLLPTRSLVSSMSSWSTPAPFSARKGGMEMRSRVSCALSQWRCSVSAVSVEAHYPWEDEEDKLIIHYFSQKCNICEKLIWSNSQPLSALPSGLMRGIFAQRCSAITIENHPLWCHFWCQMVLVKHSFQTRKQPGLPRRIHLICASSRCS